MNRVQWEVEKKKLIEEAEKNLKEFERANGGKKALGKLVKLVGKYNRLKGLANSRYFEWKDVYGIGTCPKDHIRCGHEEMSTEGAFVRCEEIVHIDDLKKEKWVGHAYSCGCDPSTPSFCPLHKNDAKKLEECGYCRSC